ncbi:MAG: hypothetical protein WBA42_18120 [Mesorhizobium sp.]
MTVLALSGCSKEVQENKESEVALVVANLGGTNLYIPRPYLDAPNTGIDPKSILLQAWYPGDGLMPSDARARWRRLGWSKNVRILIHWDVPHSSIKAWTAAAIKLQQATKAEGSEFGLLHMTQPSGAMQDHFEIWIEGSEAEPMSMISCADKQVARSPQCIHYFNIGAYEIQAHYDARLLPEWKTIQTHISHLFKSFNSSDTASAYFAEHSSNNLGDKK